MKAKVKIPFIDRYTGKLHKKGDVITISVERFNEITNGKYIEAVEDTAKIPVDDTTATTTETN